MQSKRVKNVWSLMIYLPQVVHHTTAHLVEQAGGVVVGLAFVIELTESLHGHQRLEEMGYKVTSLIEIPVEE